MPAADLHYPAAGTLTRCLAGCRCVLPACSGDKLTIYGDGKQTRSFQYVSDLLQGLIALMNCDEIDALEPEGVLPINIGNPEEYTIKEVT